ncbi:MAG: phage baseplate protein [Fusobacteriaceae bacterium]
MNNIKDTLTNMINLKLPHGGYGGTGLDLQNNKADKSITITAGKGLAGGGNLSANRTINISNADGSLVIGDDDIKVNIYDGVDSTSTNKAASPSSVKKAYDRGSEGIIVINTHTEKKDNPHAVTKEQIGLGKLQNYPMTSAVDDASNSKYSTARATKTAYDKSLEGVSKANSANDNANTRLPKIEAYLNFYKNTGDTDSHVDNLLDNGLFMCGANAGKYHLSLIDVYSMYPGHYRQIHHDWANGIAWRDMYGASSFTGVNWTVVLDTKNISSYYCPHNIGDIFVTARSGNPSGWWNNTGWEKIENRFIYAHSSAGALGGENSHYISTEHIPIHGHGGSYLRRSGRDDIWDARPSSYASANDANYFNSDNSGGGKAINNMPLYYTAYVWKRVS